MAQFLSNQRSLQSLFANCSDKNFLSFSSFLSLHSFFFYRCTVGIRKCRRAEYVLIKVGKKWFLLLACYMWFPQVCALILHIRFYVFCNIAHLKDVLNPSNSYLQLSVHPTIISTCQLYCFSSPQATIFNSTWKKPLNQDQSRLNEREPLEL